MTSKKEDDIQLMEIRRTEIADKIRMAQHKFYRREISPESFKDIVRELRKTTYRHRLGDKQEEEDRDETGRQ